MVTNEHLVFASLIRNQDFFSKVLPYISVDYFESPVHKFLFKAIKFYADKYDKQPNTFVLSNVLSSPNSKLSDNERADGAEFLQEIANFDLPDNTEYLIEEAQNYCKERALYNAMVKAIDVIEGTDTTITKESVHELIRDAVSINFDETIGQDYEEDAEARYERYLLKEEKLPFEYSILNDITNNGVSRKTLNIIAAGVNVGKSMTLVYLASMYKKMGFNVLYISNEMSEDEVMKRVDGNLLDIETQFIDRLGKSKYVSKISELRSKGQGRLKVKEYATGTCSSNRIRSLLKDYRLKENFVPDVIIVDYLTICISSRVSYTGNMGDYYTKVAEELRAVAQDFNCAMWSAAQMQTQAMDSTDPDLKDLGMSQGIAKTADLVWAVARTEELDRIGQILFKQLKTRYHHEKIRRWTMGITIAKQQFYEVEQVDINQGDVQQLPPSTGINRFGNNELRSRNEQQSDNNEVVTKKKTIIFD